jgi:hypothetical protein
MWMEKLSLIHNESDENYEYILTLHFGRLFCETNFNKELLTKPQTFQQLHEYFNKNEPRDYLYNKVEHSTDNQETLLTSIVGSCQGKHADGQDGESRNFQQESHQRQPYITAPIFNFGDTDGKALASWIVCCSSKKHTVEETVYN